MFVHREEGRGLMVSLVELDTGSMRLQQMTAKFARYEAWASSDTGQEFLFELYRLSTSRVIEARLAISEQLLGVFQKKSPQRT
jgi:hypothetical protein